MNDVCVIATHTVLKNLSFLQEMEHSADIWFSERMLPRCFNSWVEFTMQRRLHKQRRHTAEVYNQ